MTSDPRPLTPGTPSSSSRCSSMGPAVPPPSGPSPRPPRTSWSCPSPSAGGCGTPVGLRAMGLSAMGLPHRIPYEAACYGAVCYGAAPQDSLWDCHGAACYGAAPQDHYGALRYGAAPQDPLVGEGPPMGPPLWGSPIGADGPPPHSRAPPSVQDLQRELDAVTHRLEQLRAQVWG